MTQPSYGSDYEFDDFPERDPHVTSVGLPPGQLALIIGVNAVIALIISVMVVLIANRQAVPGSVAPAVVQGTPAATVSAGEAVTAPAVTQPSQVTPTPVTPVGSVNYEVQAGDTLGQIAAKFSVPVYDLMIANGLSDEDFIQIGQQLVVPLGGLPIVTVTFTPQVLSTETPLPFDPPTPVPTDEQGPPEPAVTVGPSPTPTPTVPVTPSATSQTSASQPTAAPATADTKIVITEVIGGGNLTEETLIVLNQGTGTSMLNWKLSGSSLGNFVFPDIFLFSGGSIRIHTVAGQNTPSDLYLGQSEPAWSPGTTIILSDSAGAAVSSYEVP